MKNINEFSCSNNNNKIIVIYGPTASGKTKMSIDIAINLDSEIISTDSSQIFKYLDIGTGKIKEKEKKGIKHHMIDIINPDQIYSVGEFKNKSEKIIKKLHKLNKIPILVGGTGLYIDSLIYDFDIPKVESDFEIRNSLEQEAELYGKEYIYEKLKKIDPKYAETLNPNNLRYVIRGIEVKLLTGKSKLDFRKEKKLKYETLFLTPKINTRQYLYDRINKRVDKMIEEGFIEEVKNLMKLGYNENNFGMKSIGYRELINYIKGDISLKDGISLIQQNSRNYAKRQLTWFRKYGDLIKI